MFLRVGGTEKHYAAHLVRDAWHHVAVVRTGNNFRMFLNGKALTESITVDVKAPADTPVRLGQTIAWREVYEKRFAQFYGLIDDVVIFKKAMDKSTIGLLVDERINYDEPSLVAAWLFRKKTETLPKFKRTFKLAGSAVKVFESSNRNNEADAELMLLPEPEFQFDLPFAKDQLIFVGQSPHTRGGSHFGAANFPYDFAPVTIDPTGDPVASRIRIANIPFTAVSAGKVVKVDGGHSSGKVDGTNAMFISVDGMPGFYWKHLHWETGSEKVKEGDTVKKGDVLANAGDTGVDKDNFHLHTVLVFFPDGQVPPDTGDTTTVGVPVAFVNYQRLHRVADVDTWEAIAVDMPEKPDLLIPGKQLKMKDFFNKPQLKKDLFRFSEEAVKRKLGTHDVHELVVNKKLKQK